MLSTSSFYYEDLLKSIIKQLGNITLQVLQLLTYNVKVFSWFMVSHSSTFRICFYNINIDLLNDFNLVVSRLSVSLWWFYMIEGFIFIKNKMLTQKEKCIIFKFDLTLNCIYESLSVCFLTYLTNLHLSNLIITILDSILL